MRRLFQKKKADEEVLKAVRVVLQWFQIFSGLKINFDKSELMDVNVEHRQCVELASLLLFF